MKRPNGYGCVCYLGKNRRRPYGAKVTVGRDENGRQVRKYIGYYEKRMDAEKALHEYNYNPGQFNKVTFDSLFNQWIKTKEGKISDKTLKTYLGFYQHLTPILNIDVQDIKLYHLQNIIDSHQNRSYSFQKQLRTIFNQVLNLAMINDLIDKNYAGYVEIKAQTKAKKEIFKDKDIQTLWNHLDVPYVDSILILIYTGMRIGELLKIKKFDVDIKERVIHGGIKTDAGKDRIIPLCNKILPLVKNNMKTKSEYLISRDGNKIRVDYYRKYIFYPLMRQFNFSDKLTPHSTRHTFATLLNKTVSNKQYIQKIMGHTDYNITANIYTHADIKELKDAVDSL